MGGSVPRNAAANFNRNPGSAWRHLDLLLLGATIAVACLGVLMVFSATRSTVGQAGLASTTYLVRQGIFVALGVGVMAVTAFIDYRHYAGLAPLFYGGCILLLLAVMSPLGTTVNGAQSWFAVGSFQLQPAELTKLATILVLAALCSQGTGPLTGRTVVLALAAVGLPSALILLQPDLGSALVFVAAVAAVLFVAGIQPRHLAVLALLGAFGVIYIFGYSSYLDTYQRERLTTFVSNNAQNNASFQVRQAETAIGAGGVTGAGLFQGTQTKLKYVPYQQSDFIFTVVGEELGFVGSATLLLLYSAIAWRIWRAAAVARDMFGTLLCVGVLGMLLFQIFENMGMTMGIMPITGIPLPFMSYGGSSTIMMFAAIGLVLNVHTRRFA
ncbi:MAG: Rod shape-determining protein RodA [Acidimicrobiales bacterium]|nr:Rod shape-determining protein RodA [Acidimicrobiales bacterium]